MSYVVFSTTVFLELVVYSHSGLFFLALLALQRRRFLFFDDVVFFNNDGDLPSCFD